MKPFGIPILGKLILGGTGAAVLGVSLLGAPATAAFAASPNPTAKAAQPKAVAKPDRSDRRLVRRAILSAEASVLGMKPDDLMAALRSGKTLETLAKAKGLEKEPFADRLASAAKPDLDKLVDAHKITRMQADRVLARIRGGHIPFWNGIHHRKAA